MRILAIDPGTTTGAACLRWDESCAHFWAWTRVASGYRVTGQSVDRFNMFEVGQIIGQECGDLDRLVVEGLGSKSWGAQPLIESVGELRAGMAVSGASWKNVARPLAVSRKRGQVGWRRQVLGLPDRTAAKAAEDYAIEWASKRGLPRGLTRAEQGAAAEALAMTYWEGA